MKSTVLQRRFGGEDQEAARRARAALMASAKAIFREAGFTESAFALPDGPMGRDHYEIVNQAAHAVLGAGGYRLAMRSGRTLVVTKDARPVHRIGRRAIKLTPERRAIIIRDWPAGVHVELIVERVNALPGPPFTSHQISVTASVACDVKRPPGYRGTPRRPQAPSPADHSAQAAAA